MLARALILLSFGLLLLPVDAQAQRRGRTQGPSNAAASAAREQNQRGQDAAADNRWEDALDAYSQSYELVPTPATLANVARAQAELGRVREALETYQAVLDTRPASEIARMRRQVEQAVQVLQGRVARARITLRGAQATDRIELDAAPLSLSDLAGEQTMDPGPHTMVVFRGPAEVLRREFTLTDGARQTFEWEISGVAATLVADNDASVSDEESQDDDRPRRRPLTKNPWFWVGIGAGAAVVAGVVVAVVLTTGASGSSGDGYVGNTTPGLVEF